MTRCRFGLGAPPSDAVPKFVCLELRDKVGRMLAAWIPLSSFFRLLADARAFRSELEGDIAKGSDELGLESVFALDLVLGVNFTALNKDLSGG